jgi:hypothetical protein
VFLHLITSQNILFAVSCQRFTLKINHKSAMVKPTLPRSKFALLCIAACKQRAGFYKGMSIHEEHARIIHKQGAHSPLSKTNICETKVSDV